MKDDRPIVAVRDDYEVAVIGAGPAGMAAAALCAQAGLATVLFDEQSEPGGQIYRAITRAGDARRQLIGADYAHGAAVAQRFAASGAQYVGGATVWSVSRECELGISVGGAAKLTRAKRVILATGALERPFPIEGWTLPGVLAVGAAQILLKASGAVPAGRVVLAGCGPLLYLYAWQLLRAGRPPKLIVDTTDRAARRQALSHLPAFLASRYFVKGVTLLTAVRRHVPVVNDVVELAAHGRERVEELSLKRRNGSAQTVAVDTLLLHQGVVPNVNLAMSVGIEHRWNDERLAFEPVVDEFGNSEVKGVAIAGDGAGIAGAWAAEERGKLAALSAVRALAPQGPVTLPDERAVRSALRRHLRGRRFVDVMYRPAEQFRRPSDATIVCRCEEITARQIRDTVSLGCPGPNQMKSFLRSGMGPCQGRMCGLTVTELIAQARGVSPQEVGYYRLRPPVKPVTIAELAALPKDDAAVKAVVRG